MSLDIVQATCQVALQVVALILFGFLSQSFANCLLLHYIILLELQLFNGWIVAVYFYIFCCFILY